MKMVKFAGAWAVLLIPSIVLLALAGNVGKIAGVVTDEHGDPLPGVSIRIDGTSMGAASNFDGSFIIINVPPGTYTLTAQMVGYNKMIVQGVEVKADSTAEVNFKLTASNIEISDIVVAMEKKRIDKCITQSPEKVSSEKHKQMPVSNIGDVLRLAPGLANEGGTFHARGGRGGEVAYVIDGQVLRDCLGGNGQSMPAGVDIRQNSGPFQTENYDFIAENKFLSAQENPLSTFSIDVDAASYSNMRRFLNGGRLPPADAVRIEEMVNYFDYDYPQPRGRRPFTVTTELSSCPWDNSHKLLHIGLQSKAIATDKLPPSNLVFLLDVSGSMAPDNKLPLLRRAFALLIDQLRREDRVAIVVYAGAAGLVLPSTSGIDREKIRQAVENLEAGGCTAGAAGIRLAYQTARENFRKNGNNRVILATDGDFNVGVSSDAELVRLIEEERGHGIFLSVLGFGEGNLKDSRMEQLADKGNGNYSYIDNIAEARKVLVSEMGGTLFTIAKDVKLQIEFNPARVQAYRLIGYENRILAKEDFNDDMKDAGEMGAGHAVTALYEIIPASRPEELPDVDRLKYQVSGITPEAIGSGELMTLKIRYKKPDSDRSQLSEYAVMDEDVSYEDMSDNFRFSAAVAEFGMLLHGSEFKGGASYDQVVSLARGSLGDDREGHRAEFIRLTEIARQLSATLTEK